jgi:hypothetical protein
MSRTRGWLRPPRVHRGLRCRRHGPRHLPARARGTQLAVARPAGLRPDLPPTTCEYSRRCDRRAGWVRRHSPGSCAPAGLTATFTWSAGCRRFGRSTNSASLTGWRSSFCRSCSVTRSAFPSGSKAGAAPAAASGSDLSGRRGRTRLYDENVRHNEVPGGQMGMAESSSSSDDSGDHERPSGPWSFALVGDLPVVAQSGRRPCVGAPRPPRFLSGCWPVFIS